ncbi:MAG: DUF721 domain-containing protein [Alistipes sp.]|nr:DUF721 domain-containing protein [Alistipes sp.]
MRRREAIRIGEALNEFFRTNPTVSRRLSEARLAEAWPQVAGPLIASYTLRTEIQRGGRFFVYLSSSVVRHECFMQREILRQALNQAVGMEVVTSVIVK